MAGLESQIDVEHAQEAAQQQSGADQQHAGQGYLRDHQHRAHPIMLPAGPAP